MLRGQNVLEGVDEDHPAAVTRKRNVLSISQDLLYAVSNGSNIPPKQNNLVMTSHQKTRSRAVISLLHHDLQRMSYDQVLTADNALAEKTLQKYWPWYRRSRPETFNCGEDDYARCGQFRCLKRILNSWEYRISWNSTHCLSRRSLHHNDEDVMLFYRKGSLKVPDSLLNVAEVKFPIFERPCHVMP